MTAIYDYFMNWMIFNDFHLFFCEKLEKPMICQWFVKKFEKIIVFLNFQKKIGENH